ncbi:LytR/AlgR family response regulator transcription factor [Methylotenera versatilis]|uniref:LytR/AlgR family response regulator transcription factor n=1 Tax=Methylotenera versatilis TaxID=1055487 RepID=UPI0006468788|nr:LytTR family DNA-binding domain-containing protein [Methylotenera versatilis]
MLTILIADDEAPARNRLRDLLGNIAEMHIVAEAKNGKQAIDLAIQTKPDLMLLDIRMPLMDGIEAAQHAQKLEPKPHIIFTTAFDAYAIKAFDLNAIDYLLKPIRLERLQTAIDKAQALKPKQIEALKPLQKIRSHFSIHERGRVILIPVEQVIYLRAELKYITVRTVEREYLIEESLTHLETEFGERFLRLHRNCLVAPLFITGYEKRLNEANEERWVALLKGVSETVAISRRQQHLVRET